MRINFKLKEIFVVFVTGLIIGIIIGVFIL